MSGQTQGRQGSAAGWVTADSLSGHQLGRGPNLQKSGRSWPVGNVGELPKRMRSVSVEVARENKDGISSFL